MLSKWNSKITGRGLPPMGMSLVTLQEEMKGCMRIRLYEQSMDSGKRYAVEMVAMNDWAGQGKLTDFLGGLDHDFARQFFDAAIKVIADYDWQKGKVVLEAGLPKECYE